MSGAEPEKSKTRFLSDAVLRNEFELHLLKTSVTFVPAVCGRRSNLNCKLLTTA